MTLQNCESECLCQPKRLTLQEREWSEREPKWLDFERERERCGDGWENGV